MTRLCHDCVTFKRKTHSSYAHIGQMSQCCKFECRIHRSDLLDMLRATDCMHDDHLGLQPIVGHIFIFLLYSDSSYTTSRLIICYRNCGSKLLSPIFDGMIGNLSMSQNVRMPSEWIFVALLSQSRYFLRTSVRRTVDQWSLFTE